MKELRPMLIVLLGVTLAVLLVMTWTLGRVSAYQDGLMDSYARIRKLETRVRWIEMDVCEEMDLDKEVCRELVKDMIKEMYDGSVMADRPR